MAKMTEKRTRQIEVPEISQLKAELERELYKKRYRRALRGTLGVIVCAAILVALAVFLFPTLRVTGDSMADVLKNGDIAVALRCGEIERGDLILFSGPGRKLMVRRVVGMEGDIVNMSEEGSLFINDEALPASYMRVRCESDMSYPYVVTSGNLFVLGDNPEVAVDSRSSALGCVSKDMVIGRIAVRLWPMERFEWLLGEGKESLEE